MAQLQNTNINGSLSLSNIEVKDFIVSREINTIKICGYNT